MNKPIDPKLAKFIAQSKVKERLYHGTTKDFGLFSHKHQYSGEGGSHSGSGFYFTDKPESASRYSMMRGESGSNVMPVHLNIKKPLHFDWEQGETTGAKLKLTPTQVRSIMLDHPKIKDEDESPLTNWGDIQGASFNKTLNDAVNSYAGSSMLGALRNDFFRDDHEQWLRALHKATGYDSGTTVTPNGERHYIAWFPEQIKSAIGNRGTYDPNDPDITKAGGGPVLPIGPPADIAAKLAALKEQMRQQGTNFDRRMQGVVNAEKTAGTGVTLPTDKAKGGLAHMDKGGQYPYAQAHEQARINAIKMLGLHEHNTAQDRAEAMGINTDAYHGSKQDIRGGYQPGYDDNLAFVTPDSEFANKWIGKGKHNERIGDEAKAERKAAENMYKDIKFKHMDYDELNKLEGDKFHNEYDRRNAIVKAKAKKEFGLRGTPDAIHSTVYPMKVRANKTFNPETDMHDMSDFFVKHGIPQKNIDLYKTGNYMMYETKPVVNHLKSKGYDSMRLRESTDDNYPTIAVFDPKHVRSRFAAFDPARQHENDLLAKHGGRVTHAHHLDIEERPL